jgi:hypothetical protein
MRLKGRILKRLILFLVAGIAFYFSFDFLGDFVDRQMLGDHPEVILTAKRSAKTSPKIISHTGEILSEEYKMNTPDSSQDSLELDIKVKGAQATAIINTRAVKQVSGVWKIYHSDTTFTE